MFYKKLLLFVFAFIAQFVYSQSITFKDENLKVALLELGYDFNKNNEIEISEIDTVSNLKIIKRNIKQLDDMIYFKSLRIINAMTNQIENLDVFHGNEMLEEIYIGENQLGKKLTLKNLKNLKGLYVFRNGLEEIDLRGTDNIQSLYLQGNLFKNVKFNNLSKLRSLQLAENIKLKRIDICSNKELVQLYLNDTAVYQVNIQNNPLLKTLYVEKNVKIIKNESQNKVNLMPTF